MVKSLNNYIIEKLKLSKNTIEEKENEYIESIFKIISVDIDSVPNLKEKILDWLNNYNKTLYCYTPNFYYNYEKIYLKKEELFKKISVNNISIEKILKVFNKIKENNNIWDGEDRINKIYYDDFNLAIILNDYDENEPILIEKTHV